MRLHLTIAALCALFVSQGADAAGPRLVHRAWTSEQGLPPGSIYGLGQTPDGFLWLASENGLTRFDGDTFKVFRRADAPALKGNTMSALAVGKDGALWLGQRTGLVRLRAGVWTAFGTEHGLPGVHVRSLSSASSGAVWVGTNAGLARIDGDHVTPVAGFTQAVRALLEEADGTVWIGTDLGLFVLRAGAISPAAGLTSRVNELLIDRRGVLWAAGSAGLARIEGGVAHRLPITGLPDPFPEAVALAEDRAGQVWVGTTGGLLRVEGETARPPLPELIGPTVITLAVDQEDQLWAATQGQGLHQVRASSFETLGAEDGVADFAWSVWSEADGQVWVGMRSAIAHFRPDGTVERLGSGTSLAGAVWAFARDHEGRVWVGTNNGLARLEQGPQGPVLVPMAGVDGLPRVSSRALLVAKDGALWIGTRDGLFRAHAGTVQQIPFGAKAEDHTVHTLVQDQRGRIWAGVEAGLVEVGDEGAQVRQLRAGAGLGLGGVTALLVDGPDLWVGTSDGGLSVFTGERLREVPFGAGQNPDSLLSIVDDGRGDLWLSTNRGLLRARKEALLAAARSGEGPVSLRSYDQGDGLLSAEFNGGGQSGGLRAPDGRLWLASARGVVRFDPASVPVNLRPPPVVIEGLRLDGRELASRADVEVPAGKGTVELRYTATGLRSPERLRFRYRLEGHDDAWVDAGSRRSASFQALPPGRYRFEVTAANEDGVWNEAGAAVTFSLTPPVWQRSWFRALLLLGLAGALVAFFASNERRARSREKELQALVDERTAALRQARDQMEQRVHQRTAQLEAELEGRKQLQADLLQSQKLEGLGRLAGGVAHDLNNLLTVVLGNTSLLLDEVPPAQQADLREIAAAGERAATLTKQLLAFARKQPIAPRVLDLNELILEMDKMLRRLVPENIEMAIVPGAGNSRLNADPGQLEQVLLNLVVNARDAMKSGGRLLIETRDEGPGGEVQLTVSDSGHGMTPEVRERIFEPFFTTKPQGQGTGLGLATVYGVVQQSGGRIQVESAPGRGTSFHLWFPLAEGALEPAAAQDVGVARGGAETILLVEDEPQVRRFAARVLRARGYEVLEAADGVAGLEVALQRAARIDLLLTDLVMPRMGGLELSRKLAVHWPGLAVLLVSGYSETVVQPSEGTSLLHKPFRAEELAQRVRQALDEAARGQTAQALA